MTESFVVVKTKNTSTTTPNPIGIILYHTTKHVVAKFNNVIIRLIIKSLFFNHYNALVTFDDLSHLHRLLVD